MQLEINQTRAPLDSLISDRAQTRVNLRKLSDQNASEGLSPQNRISGSYSKRVSTHLFKAEASYLARKEIPDEDAHLEACPDDAKALQSSALADRLSHERKPHKRDISFSSCESSIEELEMDLMKEIRLRGIEFSPVHSNKAVNNRRVKKHRVAYQPIAPNLPSLEFIHQKMRQLHFE